MVKDQDYLKKTASFCIDLAKKLGATDSNPETAINCLNDFSLSYQAGSDQRTPIFHQR